VCSNASLAAMAISVRSCSHHQHQSPEAPPPPQPPPAAAEPTAAPAATPTKAVRAKKPDLPFLPKPPPCHAPFLHHGKSIPPAWRTMNVQSTAVCAHPMGSIGSRPSKLRRQTPPLPTDPNFFLIGRAHPACDEHHHQHQLKPVAQTAAAFPFLSVREGLPVDTDIILIDAGFNSAGRKSAQLKCGVYRLVNVRVATAIRQQRRLQAVIPPRCEPRRSFLATIK